MLWLSLPLLSIVAASGCRGRATDDVYRARMANEIRVLEDQLYDADYQNRVLRDRLNQHSGSDQGVSSAPGLTPHVPSEIQQPIVDGALGQPTIDPHPMVIQSPMGTPIETIDGYDVLDLDQVPMGDPFVDDRPSEIPAPEPDPTNSVPNSNSPDNLPAPLNDLPAPLKDPPAFEQIPSGTGMPLPAPPTDEQIDNQPIIRGDVVPPNVDGTDPPGKVPIPSDSRTLKYDAIPTPPPALPTTLPAFTGPPETEQIAVPDHLKLHAGLSGGHQFDTDREIDGLYLVINVVDENGRHLSLNDFDVDAELSVVVLEADDSDDGDLVDSEPPASETSENDDQVGRWDFSPDQVRKMVRTTPVDGIHIPIQWKDRMPESKEVIVHIRMAAAEEEMRCQGRLRLEESVASSNWLPRG